MLIEIIFLFLCTYNVMPQVIQEETDYFQIKCLVCGQILKEVEAAILKVNPEIKVDVGGYRLDSDNKKKKIEYRTSEGYLTELMENICDKMDNFVKAKHRQSGEIIVMSLVTENGQMNSLMSEVDVIHDETLNKNLKLYCDDIIENYDEIIVNHLQKNNVDTLTSSVCELVCEKYMKKDKDEL